MVIAVALGVTGCASLPPLEGRVETRALANTGETHLAKSVAPLAAAHPGKTGIHALPNPLDAFAARVLLAAAAEKSLDVQYYIWHGDQTGYLLFDALWRAAERGVRVRLLLDDNNTKGLDEVIAALDAHPNIEVRLYNPFVHRGSRMLNFLTDFARVNRRMHNKSFTADNQATIVGGRNVGNEYFGAGEDVLFADLDVLAVGPAVQEVSDAFDLYWNSPSAYPASLLVPKVAADARDRLKAKFVEVRRGSRVPEVRGRGPQHAARDESPRRQARPRVGRCASGARRSREDAGHDRAARPPAHHRPAAAISAGRRNRSISCRRTSCPARKARRRCLRCPGAESRPACSRTRSPRRT